MERRTTIVLLALMVSCLATVDAARTPLGDLVVAATTQTVVRRGGGMSSNHSLLAFFHSSRPAPENAAGTLNVPSGLGLDGTVPLQITNVTATAGHDEPNVIAYWGSNDRVPAGQPRERRGFTADHPHYEQGSTGMADPTRLASIAPPASCSGPYTAHVSYLGDATVSFTDQQNFLDPIVISQPADGKVDFARPIVINWSRVPRASGYRVTAVAKAADGRTIQWENAWRSDAWRTRGVRAALAGHLLMPADQTTCTIPPGIFMGGPVLLRITALSPEVHGRGALRAVGYAQSMTSMELNGR